jgi:hypothetical protein
MTGRAQLLRCYPQAWRDRYGDDLAAYLDDAYAGRLPLSAVASLIAGAVREWAHVARASQAALSPAARIRAGLLTVLAGWAAFVVAGAGFAKITEHFDSSLSPGAHTVPDVAYTVVQVVATVSGLAAVAGLLLAAPAVVRFLSGGGWQVIRRHVLRAVVGACVTAGATVATAAWAHELTSAQRNGGNAGYVALFVVWAALVAATVALWTVAAVAAGRRLTLPRTVLLAEGALASAVTVGMLVMLVAAAVWWAAVASSAPSFFGGAPYVAAAWTPQLVGTAVLMLTALAVGAVGVVRIVRALPAL